MKKITKAVVALMTTSALFGAMVGCGDPTTTVPPTTEPTTPPTTEIPTEPPVVVTTSYGVGYGMVHGAGYVARANVALDGDKIVDVAWDEACLPTYVTAAEGTPAEDTVTVEVTSHGSLVEKTFYKTVKFGGVTMTYDAEAKTYMVDGMTMVEWFQNEANCKTYYDAVFASRVAVVVAGEEDTTVLDAMSLLKSHNGYWKGNNYPLGYRGNYDKTVAYLKEYGIEAAKTLVKDGTWYDENDVDTGATWTDLNTKKENSLSYVQLVELAINNAVTATYANAYGMVHGAGYVAGALVAVDENGKLIDVAWDEACLPTYVTAAEGTPAEDTVTVEVTSHGKLVEKTFYKTVKYGDVVMTYDAEAKTYTVDGVSMVEWFQTEANAEAYFNAVAASEVAVVVAGEEDTTVMTAAALMKVQNGYWNGNYTLGYWGNYGRTIEYMVTYGLDAAQTLVKDGTWYDENDVDTGATWTDLNTEKENTLSYVQLVVRAADKL